MSVLVLNPVSKRSGDLKRLDVVAAAGSKADGLDGIAEGEYTVLDTAASTVENVRVSYRTVQDVETV